MLYLLDTNICIYLLKQRSPQVLKRLEALQEGEVMISVVTYAELRAGLDMQTANREHDEQILTLLTSRIPVVAFDPTAAERFGELRAAVRDRRRDALDRLIAAHAVRLDATLVTNNEADFNDYPGLKVENWTRAITLVGRYYATSPNPSRAARKRLAPPCCPRRRSVTYVCNSNETVAPLMATIAVAPSLEPFGF